MCTVLHGFFHDRNRGAIVFANNMKGHDGVFLLGYLLKNSIVPQNLIYSGSKIMYFRVQRGLDIRVLNSLNFFQLPLASLPASFGLSPESQEDVLRKGYFPHFFNTSENFNYVGPYPDADYYGADSMSTKDKAQFLLWLEEKKAANTTFDFAKEIDAYCKSDVTIYRQACLKCH